MKTEPVPLFFNPVAGRGRAGRSIRQIAAKLDSLGVSHVLVEALNVSLPEIVYDVLKPLYTLFDFFNLSKRLVEEELRDMRRSEF